MLAKDICVAALGLATCTLCLLPVFVQSYEWGCGPYDELLAPLQPAPSGMTDNLYGIAECFSSGVGRPEDLAIGLLALPGMFLVGRLSSWTPERAAVGVGVVGSLLAALIGFARSGLDPVLALTDPGFYFSLPMTITLGVILGKVERRRRSPVNA
jgi:hypothetical protein